jgi:hypothetical protein
MADRIEREIEEILAKLDQDGPLAPEKKPVSIMSARTKKKTSPPRPPKRRANPLANINPTTFLFVGAGLVVGGLILSNVWSPLIWASFAGVVIFLGAFLSSFLRSGRPAAGSQPRGVYWRDRYIEYEPASTGMWDRLRRRFRR